MSGGAPDRNVFLILTGPGGSGRLIFIAPPEFQDGYSNEIEGGLNNYLTHNIIQMWKGGKFDDMSVTLEIVAGVSPEINTADDVTRVVEVLYSWAMTPNGIWLDAVTLTLTAGGSVWFQRLVHFLGVSPKFTYPFDMTTGKPMRCEISLTLRPTYSLNSGQNASRLPARPYLFSKG